VRACMCVELGVSNSLCCKYLGPVPHKRSYISSVAGRGATGIKKSLSSPLL